MDTSSKASDAPEAPEATEPAKVTKKSRRKELVWRRPSGLRFDISPTDRVDDDTFAILDALCPRRRVLLQYSTGKDSCAAWIELVARGYTVVPIFKEIFRDLSFFTAPIAAAEEFFKTQVHIIPHRGLLLDRMGMFNDLNDLAKLGKDFKDLVNGDHKSSSFRIRYAQLLTDKLLAEHDCDVSIIGTKASDSLHRRTHFKVDGPYLPRERTFSLVWRLKKSAPYQIMLDAGFPIPRYYLWLGRSPELLLEHEFAMIREHYPEDYAKLRAVLKNLDAYLAKYDKSPDFKHVIKPPKILIEAAERGYKFV